MNELRIRPAEAKDLPDLDRLLYQVHKVHSDARPDLFKPGAKKYTGEELKKILADPNTPVFIAELDGQVKGYAFCIHKQFPPESSMTPVKTLYIDDLCVDETLRGQHVGRTLYEAALSLARENGCYNVTLNVWSCNPSALRFYEHMGMVPQKIYMEKIL